MTTTITRIAWLYNALVGSPVERRTTIDTALRHGTRILTESSIALPDIAAEALLAHAMQCDRSYVLAHSAQELSQHEWEAYNRYLNERISGKPTPYITNRQRFHGREFLVTSDVLIPRRQTEYLVDVALDVARGACRILDLGTGSGAVGITLQLETHAAAWATDISPGALVVARENARRLGASVEVVACDVMSAIGPSTVDLIVTNPPYVPLYQRECLQPEVRDWEPHVALFGGESGYEFHDRIVADAPRVLRPGGWLIMEMGTRSLDHVSHLLRNWSGGRVVPDHAGIPRVIAVRRP